MFVLAQSKDGTTEDDETGQRTWLFAIPEAAVRGDVDPLFGPERVLNLLTRTRRWTAPGTAGQGSIRAVALPEMTTFPS